MPASAWDLYAATGTSHLMAISGTHVMLAVDLFKAGNHGSTYGGTPLACRASLAVIQLLQEGAIDNAAVMGERMIQGFKTAFADLDVEVNGRGLMIGLRLAKPCAELVAQARDEEKLLINVTADSVIRLLPALNISAEEADEIVNRVSRLVRRFLNHRTDASHRD